MNCENVRQLLPAYFDDELDLATALQIEAHLPDCPGCRQQLESAQAVRSALTQPGVYLPAPAALRERLTQAIRSEAGETESGRTLRLTSHWWMRPMALSGIAAALLVVIGSLALYLPVHASRGQIDDLVDSHVRSLEANHLFDVESTDQHTVKPWFTDKLDFSPPVTDFAVEGFPLAGGRLDYLGGRKVAALIYHRKKHVINVFIWPADESPSDEPPGGAPETTASHGFNLIRFDCKGMVCWAISDLNAAELQQFVDLFKTQRAASTRS
jgi:anti-sigma factor RsiW